jgi:hypothetical protein
MMIDEDREASAIAVSQSPAASPDDERMSYTQIVEEFVFSEAIYLASLETLWMAYLLPLTNACHRGLGGGSATAEGLLEKFGGDLMQIIACHKLILAQISITPLTSGDDPEDGNNRVESVRGGISSLGLSSSSSGGDRNSEGCAQRLQGTSRVGDTPDLLLSQPSKGIAFPLLLLRMAPSMEVAYNNYVLHFADNMQLAETARAGVAESLWEVSYANFARDLLNEKLSSSNIPSTRIDTSFAALIAAPMQRLARYSLLITEWLKEHRGEDAGGAAVDDEYSQASRALLAIQGVCKSVNQTQIILENARRLLEIQQRYRITGLSTQLLLNEASVTHAVFPPNAGIYASAGSVSRDTLGRAPPLSLDGVKLKTATIFLFSELILIVHFRDMERKRRGSVVEIPLSAIESVRNLKAIPASSSLPSGGFVLKISPGAATSSKFKNSQQEIATEYVLLDEDELSVAIWVQDVTMAVHSLIHAQ